MSEQQAGADSRPSRIVPSLVALAVGIAGIVGSVQLGIGVPAEPGPGMWPLAASCLLTVFAAASTAIDLRAAPGPLMAVGWPVLLGVASLAVYILAFRSYGLVLPTFAVLVIWLRFLAREDWGASFAVAAAATAAFWLVFGQLLQVPLPIGPFGG